MQMEGRTGEKTEEEDEDQEEICEDKKKKIGFVAMQHIMETPEEEKGDTFAQCTCLSLHSCI